MCVGVFCLALELLFVASSDHIVSQFSVTASTQLLFTDFVLLWCPSQQCMSDFRPSDRLVRSVLRWLAIRVPFTAVMNTLRENGEIELVRFLPDGLHASMLAIWISPGWMKDL